MPRTAAGSNDPRTAAEGPGLRPHRRAPQPRRASRDGRPSEMATGVVVGSAVILAPASPPPLGAKNAQASQAAAQQLSPGHFLPHCLHDTLQS
jgi:hypothetical protein